MASGAEQVVGVAAKLYQARGVAKSLAGDLYRDRVEKWMALVRIAMEREQKDALPTVLVLAEHTQDAFDLMWLFAAAVEIIEAEVTPLQEEQAKRGTAVRS
jgi:hypothetical protein